ncbi:MAG: energy transducer TonB [Bacteroidales bacterium]|nr:MAG: energy transducer TonB [Bacteroidales bacterium]
MELKKTDKADLEKRKGIFFQLGLVIVLSLVLIAFEWTSTGLSKNEFDTGAAENVEEEIIPITRQEQPEPEKPPEPPKVTEILNIVEDDVVIEDELILEDTEIDMETEVEVIEFEVEEEEAEEAEIFFIVEDMPSFQGKGQEGFREWIAKNLRYPEIAAENGISGRVFVQFVVEPDGSVNKVEVIRGVDPALDKEAIRVVSSSPKWEPGKQRGKPVRVSYTFPIVFVLQ